MIRIHTEITRKLGLPRYSSAQASCGLDAEFDASLLSNPDRLAEAIRGLQHVCAAAVDEELGRIEAAVPRVEEPTEPPASTAQLRVLQSLARRRGIALAELLEGRFQITEMALLTRAQASTAIDLLRGSPPARGYDRSQRRWLDGAAVPRDNATIRRDDETTALADHAPA